MANALTAFTSVRRGQRRGCCWDLPSENAETKVSPIGNGPPGVPADPGVAREILEFIEKHRVLSVAMTDGIIGCPHQEGVYYEGDWCPVCEFWHGRDRFTGQQIH